MTQQNYVFNDHEDNPERIRLKAIQKVHDPVTMQLLSQLGLRSGKICAEIGAGEGSIARHIASSVKPGGKVVAIDLNTRFLEDSEQLEVRRMDITADPLEENFFDIIHARYVMLHVKNTDAALDNIGRALKVGGVLLLEEPDFRTGLPVSTDTGFNASIEKVNQAILSMYTSMGIDPALGTKLPRILRDRGYGEVKVSTDLPLAPGGAPIATMMGMSINYLRTRLVETRIATNDDINNYIAATQDPNVWTTYYTTVSVWGRKS